MEPHGDPTTVLKPWLDLLVSYGWPSIISGMVTWLLWRLIPFIPEWVRASVDAQKQVPLELSKINQSMEDIVAIYISGDENIRSALHHLARAFRKKLHNLPDAEILHDLDHVIEITRVDKRE